MGADQGKATNLNALAVAAERARQADRRSRADDVPSALRAGDVRRLRRPRAGRPVRSDPRDAAARLGGAAAAPCSRTPANGSAPRAFRCPARRRKKRSSANAWRRAPAPGIQDASTLGKIEVVGPDAVEFLKRLYVNAFAKLAVGRCRYALMLSEDGYVIDDGVVMRLAEDRFHVTTTTGGAGRVFAMMEDYRQTEWPDLKVWATSITEQYATIAINGPKAREILAPLAEGIDLSPAAFPHMSVREGRVAGVAGAAGARQLHRRSRVRGQRSRRLRRERAGGDLGRGREGRRGRLRARRAVPAARREGLHDRRPGDRRLGDARRSRPRRAWSRWPSPISSASARCRLPISRAPGAASSSGCCPKTPPSSPTKGAQIVAEAAPPKGAAALGWVTSAYLSPTLGRSFALALVADGRNRLGETLFATTMEAAKPVKLVEPVFYDKEGRRLEL